MGDVKNNVKSADPKTESWLTGIKDVIRPKVTSKASAQTVVDVVADLDKRLNDLIIAKRQDVKNEPSRYDYNAKVLTHLELAQTFHQRTIESLAEIANLADDDSGKRRN